MEEPYQTHHSQNTCVCIYTVYRGIKRKMCIEVQKYTYIFKYTYINVYMYYFYVYKNIYTYIQNRVCVYVCLYTHRCFWKKEWQREFPSGISLGCPWPTSEPSNLCDPHQGLHCIPPSKGVSCSDQALGKTHLEDR